MYSKCLCLCISAASTLSILNAFRNPQSWPPHDPYFIYFAQHTLGVHTRSARTSCISRGLPSASRRTTLYPFCEKYSRVFYDPLALSPGSHSATLMTQIISYGRIALTGRPFCALWTDYLSFISGAWRNCFRAQRSCPANKCD